MTGTKLVGHPVYIIYTIIAITQLENNLNTLPLKSHRLKKISSKPQNHAKKALKNKYPY